MANAINIILGKTDVNGQQQFVEIEDDDGKSIRIGAFSHDGPFMKLRITIDDIKRIYCRGDQLRMIRATDKLL